MAKKDAAEQVPYQQAAQVRQALAERELAQAYGNDEAVRRADKLLDELGVKAEHRQHAKADAKADAEPETKAPQGRQAPAKQTADTASGSKASDKK